ncbi:MAG: cytochrome c biogenesis protein CcsA [Halieaceae bacterium]|nr:cytochrome c biogenesis protein CcsA [Halieaceae bacterium]
MASASVAALVAAILYIAVSFLQARRAARRTDQSPAPIYALATIAVILHGVGALSAMAGEGGINFSLFPAGSLIFWMVNVSLLVSLAWRPLQNLMVVLFPISALSVLLATLLPTDGTLLTELSSGMLAHITTSILAYAVLAIAAVQAGAVAAQDYQLRHRQTRGLVQLLPPLQLMESILFEIVWVGLALLTVAIASGFIFIDDIFAQHLVHKTVLSICAWLLFATLLWGHHQLGWRSQVAARFTLGGFAALALAYAGSKFVLEVILQRG